MPLSYVHPYIPNSASEVRQAMLDAINATSVEELFADVPEALRVQGALDLPPALPVEQDLARHVADLLSRNASTDERTSFLGFGVYRHSVPAVVDEVIGRSEFLTAYAGEPYDDHGRFQALFEYQSLMGELLGMDVVNVPTYDGYQAAATAVAMAGRITGRRRVLQLSDPHPHKLDKVRDFVSGFLSVETIPTSASVANISALPASLDDDVAAVWIETPSVRGSIEENLSEISQLAHAAGAIVVVGTEPLLYGVLEPPAGLGADIVTGEIQSLGLHQWFGGARGGFIALHDDPQFVMELPSRLFGLASTSVPGELGFGDVAYERTSFALREEGKEWVGTAAALWGIAAGVYLALMGPRGMRDIGETILARTAYAQRRVAAIPGARLSDPALHFREFCVEFESASAVDVVAATRRAQIDAGVVLDERSLLICVTEMTTREEIDRLADAIAAALGDVDAQNGARQ
ncbi:glycine dehydrogenase subunit 1 [Xylanimonas ulmi]|uniref:Glycine dehydrogenase subunit 1 n=2 Tax=Xylanimonas ulmi TaxID=228973 RepID=A0A4Q7LZX2_9MICO|nr:glycine dehydrogenase subunit 1 [Xylanibacterium ulmi]